MTMPSRPLMIRLPADVASRFDRLCREFTGLPPATVARMILADQLNKNIKEQVEAVTRQVRQGGSDDEAPVRK